MQNTPGLRLLQVEREALLIAVEAVEELAVVAPVAVAEKERADPARHVAAVGRVLDLDDLGAEIGQLHRAVGARPILLDRNDPKTGKGRQHVSSSSLALPPSAYPASPLRSTRYAARSVSV